MQPKTKNTRRIRQVSVTNLFGIFNHTIPLKMDEHITIIHGPNGFGKTMMFRLLYALFGLGSQISQSYQLLQDIPFDEFKVDFEDRTSFWVSKTSQSHKMTEEGHPSRREIIFQATGNEPYSLHPKTLLSGSVSLSITDHAETHFESMNDDTWKNNNTGEILSSEDVVERFGDRLSSDSMALRGRIPNWLVDMIESVPIRFIETQRLLGSTKRSLYNKYEKTIAFEYAITEHTRRLGISAELAKRRDLLTTIVNSRFLYKTMTIDKEKGLVFTTNNGTSLSFENLSSGEQHELVLFYDLLFRVAPGSLILLDEPELSLHVVWQRQFLKDLQEVTALAKIDIILATHSPSLISDRRDLLVGLKGPEDGRP